jgi:hypothetical protein
MWGNDSPWAVATPTHLPQERGGSIIVCGECARGADEVRTFGAWWGLKMFNILSQIATKHFRTKAQNLGELVVDRISLY